MITILLFLIIGLKLHILKGWYMALLIIKSICWLIELWCKAFKLGRGE